VRLSIEQYQNARNESHDGHKNAEPAKADKRGYPKKDQKNRKADPTEMSHADLREYFDACLVQRSIGTCSRLPTDQDQYASRDGENWDYYGELAEAESKKSDQPDHDQVYREQEHSEIAGEFHNNPPWVVGKLAAE
jgi:hypothetical protein